MAPESMAEGVGARERPAQGQGDRCPGCFLRMRPRTGHTAESTPHLLPWAAGTPGLLTVKAKPSPRDHPTATRVWMLLSP